MAGLTGIGDVSLPENWTAQRMGALLEQIRVQVPVLKDRDYPLLGVKWYAGGPFVREVVDRVTTEASTFQAVPPGCLIYNRLFAWKGSFGIVPEELAGTYASNEFPLFVARTASIDLRFYKHYLCQTWLWEYVADESTGATATSRNRWKEESLRSLVVPVPPLDEQVRRADFLDASEARWQELSAVTGIESAPSPGSLPDLTFEYHSALITAVVTGALDPVTTK